MIESLHRTLGDKYYFPIPLWNMVPASNFWSVSNFAQMGFQGIKRLAQTTFNGKPEVFLDASGYQLGDPWKKMSTALSMRLTFYQYYKKKGVKIILLPQSMGPFNDPLIASTAAGILQLADLVFVRCEISRAYALSVGCPEHKLFIAPDYSNLTPPIFPESPEAWSDSVCLVPSMRMMDKTTEQTSTSYLDALQQFIRLIKKHGLNPFFLIHQAEDMKLALEINRSMETPIQLVDPEPMEAKGILASCRAVIGSRYHSIISALSQGTPVIGTGWTHKYQSLFDDYECRQFLLSSYDSAAIEDSLAKILDEKIRASLIETLQKRADEIKGQTRKMYNMLTETIDS